MVCLLEILSGVPRTYMTLLSIMYTYAVVIPMLTKLFVHIYLSSTFPKAQVKITLSWNKEVNKCERAFMC